MNIFIPLSPNYLISNAIWCSFLYHFIVWGVISQPEMFPIKHVSIGPMKHWAMLSLRNWSKWNFWCLCDAVLTPALDMCAGCVHICTAGWINTVSKRYILPGFAVFFISNSLLMIFFKRKINYLLQSSYKTIFLSLFPLMIILYSLATNVLTFPISDPSPW